MDQKKGGFFWRKLYYQSLPFSEPDHPLYFFCLSFYNLAFPPLLPPPFSRSFYFARIFFFKKIKRRRKNIIGFPLPHDKKEIRFIFDSIHSLIGEGSSAQRGGGTRLFLNFFSSCCMHMGILIFQFFFSQKARVHFCLLCLLFV